MSDINDTKKRRSYQVTRSLASHSAVGVVLGAVMYILALTGTLVVFNHELQRWEQPYAPEMDSISPAAAAIAAKTVFVSEASPTTHLYINFPQPDLPRTVITTDEQAFFANDDGTIAGKEYFPWTQFLLDLHYYLHLPHILGLTIVGIVGVFFLMMSISGFVAHRRIFRDAFTFRRGEGIVPKVDLHNRLSVWTSPFHISNALTGAILGLASILAFAIASVNFDGDTEQVFGPIFGEEAPIEEGTAPLANIESPIQYMQEHFPDYPATYLILHDPGTLGQHTSIIAEHQERLIFGEYYNFDANGNYLGNVGISDGTIGQQIFGSVYNVHFGNWGGLAIKLAYAIFGFILCTVVVSGIRIYLLRRQQKGNDVASLAAGWEAIVWGVPALLVLTLLITVSGILKDANLTAVFWLGLFACIAVATRCSNAEKVKLFLTHVTSILLLLSLVGHSITYGPSVLSYAALPLSIFLIALSIGLLIYGGAIWRKSNQREDM